MRRPLSLVGEEPAHRAVVPAKTVVANQRRVDRRALHALDVPLLDQFGECFDAAGRLAHDARSLGLAARAQRLQDLGLRRQRPGGVEPALLLGDAAQPRQLGAPHDPVSGHLPVALAASHAVQRLSVLVHFDSPVGHLRTPKGRRVWRVGENRNARWLIPHAGPNRRSAPGSMTRSRTGSIGRSPTGSNPPITDWLQWGDR